MSNSPSAMHSAIEPVQAGGFIGIQLSSLAMADDEVIKTATNITAKMVRRVRKEDAIFVVQWFFLLVVALVIILLLL